MPRTVIILFCVLILGTPIAVRGATNNVAPVGAEEETQYRSSGTLTHEVFSSNFPHRTAPVCQVTPTSLSFTVPQLGQSDVKTFTIQNIGGETLSGTVTETCPEFSVTPNSYSLGEGQSRVFTVTYSPEDCGNDFCTIVTSTPCADVSCSATGPSSPQCEVLPADLAFSCELPGCTDVQYFTITNIGCGTLSGTVTPEGCDEITVEPGGYELGPGQSRMFTVTFTCAQVGWGGCMINTGTDCGWVMCDWECLLPYRITSITDVGNDQGRRVRVRWNRHGNDMPDGNPPVTSYTLWRRVDQNLLMSGGNVPEGLQSGRAYPPGEWEFVETVPAFGEETYTAVCETLCDSTGAGGICWSVFFVRAGTEMPTIYFDTAPDSGYSVDNLEPAAPEGLIAALLGEGVTLTWDPNEEEDLNYYAVYRWTEPPFSLDNPIGYSTEPAYTDSDLPGPGEYWYGVTATDFSGNESATSDPVSVDLTSVEEPEGTIPGTFFLGWAVPNPFNPVTEITYGIPAGSPPSRVVIHVYDATGRMVTTLVDGDRGPGVYRVVWDSTDRGGAEVTSGVYFCRIQWSAKSITKRMVLLK